MEQGLQVKPWNRIWPVVCLLQVAVGLGKVATKSENVAAEKTTTGLGKIAAKPENVATTHFTPISRKTSRNSVAEFTQ